MYKGRVKRLSKTKSIQTEKAPAKNKGKTMRESREWKAYMNRMKQAILREVNRSGGIKVTELAIVTAGLVDADGTDFVNLVEKLVKKGELVEVEYIRPDAPDRIKSFLLPKGTLIHRPDGMWE